MTDPDGIDLSEFADLAEGLRTRGEVVKSRAMLATGAERQRLMAKAAAYLHAAELLTATLGRVSS